MNTSYIEIRAAGFIAYSGAFIARFTGMDLHAYMLDFVGTPSAVKALSAILFSGEPCRISAPVGTFREFDFFTPEHKNRDLIFPEKMQTYRTRKIGDVVNKTVINPYSFTFSTDSTPFAVIYGVDMPTVIDRAFLAVNVSTTIPLKKEWSYWLWDEILQPEKLHSFGSKDLQEAYLISWPDDDILRERLIEANSAKYLN